MNPQNLFKSRFNALYCCCEGRKGTETVFFPQSTTIPTILWGSSLFSQIFLCLFFFICYVDLVLLCNTSGNCMENSQGCLHFESLKCSRVFTNTIKRKYFCFMYISDEKNLYLLQLCTVKRSLFLNERGKFLNSECLICSDYTTLYTYMMFRHDMIVKKKKNKKHVLTAQFEGASEQCPFLSYFFLGRVKKKSSTMYSFICL